MEASQCPGGEQAQDDAEKRQFAQDQSLASLQHCHEGDRGGGGEEGAVWLAPSPEQLAILNPAAEPRQKPEPAEERSAGQVRRQQGMGPSSDRQAQEERVAGDALQACGLGRVRAQHSHGRARTGSSPRATWLPKNSSHSAAICSAGSNVSAHYHEVE